MANKKQIIEKLLKKCLWGGVILLFPFLFIGQVSAEEVPISVNPILPENQRTANAGYFDLMMTPGQTQELMLEITNQGVESVTLDLTIHSASTGDNGTIDYTRSLDEKDETLVYPLPQLVKVDPTVSVAAQETISVPIQVAMPSESFNGKILGAVRIAQAGTEKVNDDNSGISITNKFAYVIAIQLQENEEPIREELKLKSIRASQVAGRNTLKAQLQNPTPTLIDQVTYVGQVSEKGKGNILHENHVENYRVAPNTSFNYPISWGTQKFKAGTYTLKLTAESKMSGEQWSFEQDFIITEEEAKELNATAIGLEEESWLLYSMIISGILFGLLVISIFLYVNKKQKEKKRQRIKRKNKGKKKRSSPKRKENG